VLDENAPCERMEEAAREDGSISPWEWESERGGLEGVTWVSVSYCDVDGMRRREKYLLTGGGVVGRCHGCCCNVLRRRNCLFL
jgi:hypothetical protein